MLVLLQSQNANLAPSFFIELAIIQIFKFIILNSILVSKYI